MEVSEDKIHKKGSSKICNTSSESIVQGVLECVKTLILIQDDYVIDENTLVTLILPKVLQIWENEKTSLNIKIKSGEVVASMVY